MTISEKLLDIKFKIGLLSTTDLAEFYALHFPSPPVINRDIVRTSNKAKVINNIENIRYVAAKDILIMQFVADGFTASQIANRIGLSNRTIEHRILDLRKKLSCKTITQLAISLLRANIIK